jgi:hypothetical protein
MHKYKIDVFQLCFHTVKNMGAGFAEFWKEVVFMDTIWKTCLRVLVVLCRVSKIEQSIYIAEITLCEIVCWTGSLCRKLCSNIETIMEHKSAIRPMCRQTSKRICNMGTVTTRHKTIHALLIRYDMSLHFIESKSLLVTVWSPENSIIIVPGYGLD